jgi:recombinational DNA repair protein (RecF pathway)
MSGHHKYTTEALVLELRPRREHDALLILFTHDLGVIYAVAAGLRKGVAKMRSLAQAYSHIRASVVQGKESWRLTNAEEYAGEDIVRWRLLTKDAQKTYVRLAQFFIRYMPKEEKHTDLFERLNEALSILADPQTTQEEMVLIECLVVMQSLHAFGSLALRDGWQRFIDAPIGKELFLIMKDEKASIVKSIEQSLESTHL